MSNTKLILGTERPDSNSLRLMRDRTKDGMRWAAYQNVDLGHPDLGHLQFLAIGPKQTYKEPPKNMPDTPAGIGWRYIHVGWVDLKTGEISEL